MKRVMIAVTMLMLAACLWGQSNDMLDAFLDAEEADTATAMLLVGQASGALALDADPDAGYTWGVEQDFGKHVEKREPEDPVTLGLFYLALLKSFDVKGGIWFNLVGTPRQAALEAGFMGYVEPSSMYYNKKMAPYEVLTGITYVMEDAEGGEL